MKNNLILKTLGWDSDNINIYKYDILYLLYKMPIIQVYLTPTIDKKVENLSKIKRLAKADIIQELIISSLKNGEMNKDGCNRSS